MNGLTQSQYRDPRVKVELRAAAVQGAEFEHLSTVGNDIAHQRDYFLPLREVTRAIHRV